MNLPFIWTPRCCAYAPPMPPVPAALKLTPVASSVTAYVPHGRFGCGHQPHDSGCQVYPASMSSLDVSGAFQVTCPTKFGPSRSHADASGSTVALWVQWHQQRWMLSARIENLFLALACHVRRPSKLCAQTML